MTPSTAKKSDPVSPSGAPIDVTLKMPPASVRFPTQQPGSFDPRASVSIAEVASSAPVDRWSERLHVFTRLLIPGPFVHENRLSLAASMLADYSLVILGFYLTATAWKAVGIALYRLTLAGMTEPYSPALMLLFGAFFILLGYSEHLYDETNRDPKQQTLSLGKVAAWSALLFTIALRLAGTGKLFSTLILASSPLNFLTMTGWRNWRRFVNSNATAAGHGRKNILIIGAGSLARGVANKLIHPNVKSNVVGFVDNDAQLDKQVIGRIKDLERIALANFVDEVVIALPRRSQDFRAAIAESRRLGLDIKLAVDLFGFVPKSRSSRLKLIADDPPLLALDEEPIQELALFLKRGLDILLSSFALVTLLPLLLTIAATIKLQSPGPILYQAPRVGKKGTRFDCLKFRTMIDKADERKTLLRSFNERQGASFKISNDPRITRIGKFLRRYSLDELPQLWNVLRGEMSLVGPRPHPLDDYERYELTDLKRLNVTPGITGLWQVTARQDPSFQRNVALDLEYIKRWNVWMDLKILCKTVSAVLQGSGT